jgi:hypothetical protein
MPDLSFRVESAEPVNFAATPALVLKLRIDNADPRQAIQTVALRCQIQMEVTRRRYSPEEQEHLVDLFGEPSRWSQTLRNRLWTNVNLMVSPFEGSTVAGLEVPCTFDFNIAATKYFHGLSEGDVPLCLMFSGTIFYTDEAGALKAAPIPWEKETRYRLPVRVWKDMMDLYYPNTAWLNVRRDVFDRLNRYKMSHGIPAWEQVLERLLGEAESKNEAEAESKEFVAS